VSTRISWHDARAIAGAVSSLAPELVTLDESVGRRLIEDLVTPIDLPHFASSAMDGWLVVGDGPWTLTDDPPGVGQARIIVTGAFVPPTATAVLRSESGVVVDLLLRSTVPDEPRPGQHIRSAGGEASRGETLIGGGTLLNPAHVALAASTGTDGLRVAAVPTIALILTGDEVVTNGVPGLGQVRDSFGVQLPALFGMLGGRVTRSTRVGDDIAATVQAIVGSPEPLIVTTGGTGASAVDHVRAALRALDARVLIDGVAMRPGGPTSMAELPDGRLVVSLPGNPLAAMVSAITLCEPLLAGLGGIPERMLRTVVAPAVAGRPGSTSLVPHALIDGRSTIAAWRGSGMMRGLAGAHGLLVVPSSGLAEGDPAESVDLPWPAT
jgi:molybdopterin molybdotransferase